MESETIIEIDLEGGGLREVEGEGWRTLVDELEPIFETEEEYVQYYCAEARKAFGASPEAVLGRRELCYNAIRLQTYNPVTDMVVTQWWFPEYHPLARMMLRAGSAFPSLFMVDTYNGAGKGVVAYSDDHVQYALTAVIGMCRAYGVAVDEPDLAPALAPEEEGVEMQPIRDQEPPRKTHGDKKNH
jgi:hypothetical protein